MVKTSTRAAVVAVFASRDVVQTIAMLTLAAMAFGAIASGAPRAGNARRGRVAGVATAIAWVRGRPLLVTGGAPYRGGGRDWGGPTPL